MQENRIQRCGWLAALLLCAVRGFGAEAGTSGGGLVRLIPYRDVVHLVDGSQVEGTILFSGLRGIAIVVQGRERFVPRLDIYRVERLPTKSEALLSPAQAALLETYAIGLEEGQYVLGATAAAPASSRVPGAPSPPATSSPPPSQPRPRPPAEQTRWPGSRGEIPSESKISPTPEVETISTGGSTSTSAQSGAPSIVSPLTAGALLNAAFEYQIVATNHPTSYNATGLPPGLRINTATGVISGTPTREGVYRVTLSATNSYGTTRATLTLTVSASLAIPDITSPLTAAATQGQTFSYTITATNGPTVFDAENLPNGLTIDTRTGRISGIPLENGVFHVALSAANAAGTGRAVLTLTVSPPKPVITSALTVTSLVEKIFQYQITATNNPTAFDASGLPVGLAINKTTGLISGTVSAAAAGEYSIVLSASNAAGTGTALLTANFTYAVFKVNGQPPEDAEVVFGEPFDVEVEFYRADYAPAVRWRSYALGAADTDRAEWKLEGDTQASAGALTIKHAADGSTGNTTFGWDTTLTLHYQTPSGADTATAAYLALVPVKNVTLKSAWHPNLGANRRDLMRAFNIDDAPLARQDNDGPRHLQD
ncbi:MAG: Ig domain-containing protein, partial [Planctomycetota bacterium]|nr:Ig domain-containing protein [Planctomycetota bacterium]